MLYLMGACWTDIAGGLKKVIIDALKRRVDTISPDSPDPKGRQNNKAEYLNWFHVGYNVVYEK